VAVCNAAQENECLGPHLLPTIGMPQGCTNDADGVGSCVCGDDCSGPREDATRIGSAGVVRRQAVDISPLRRVNQVRRPPVPLGLGLTRHPLSGEASAI
jgi:hypothetical protein